MEHRASGWMWYPGDLELYHALRQNFSRVERGKGWPAYWKSSGFRQRVAFWRTYTLEAETQLRVLAHGTGFVRLIEERANWHIDEISRQHERKEYKYAFGETITCGPGNVTIVIHVGRIEAMPSAYVEGDVICSDEGWTADDYNEPQPAAGSRYFRDPGQDPAEWPYAEEQIPPAGSREVEGGTLYCWPEEMTAQLKIEAPADRLAQMTVYPGESEDEALDPEHCYLRWKPDAATGLCPRCAVRYVFIPGDPVQVTAVSQFVEYPERASFSCDDPLLNRIWEVSERTFRLCSGIFFIDGIKRDQWIWSGDAYQSIFVNRYLLADPEIETRTLTALRGSDPMYSHINTIMDYSLFWILSVMEHDHSAGDPGYLTFIYPKMRSLMDFCEQRTDENGFLTAREHDWVYIDWAELDKEGPIAGEQMLYAAAWDAMSAAAGKLGREEEAAAYAEKAAALRQKIRRYYWSEERGAYIDSYVSGRNYVSRQTNILAIRTGCADAAQQGRILRGVLHDPEIPAIRTPYFQFYALDALGTLGELDTVLSTIRSYWGGMLERGAVTFWEEFDPTVTGTSQYDMYGDRFGKSLCHAWAASPVYLLARYFVGLETVREEKLRCVLRPQLQYFGKLDVTLPVGMDGASAELHWDGEELRVRCSGAEGTLYVFGRETALRDGAEAVLRDQALQPEGFVV